MVRLSAALGSACLGLVLAAPAPAAAADDRYRDQLQPAIEEFVRREHVPGLAIAVIENNKVVYVRGFGVMTKAGTDAVSERSLFHVASTTKPFVATAVMQLVESGKVDLAAPVAKYLPYFRLADDRYKSITVRHMLTHSSGMPDVEDYEWDKPQYGDGALEGYVRGLTGRTLLFAPGSRFAYSNMAYDVLGDLIAKASGQSFEDYVERQILAPLGMADSTLTPKRADPRLVVAGHVRAAGGGVVVSTVAPYNRIHSPSSNLLSSAADMARWARANLNGGELDGKRVLKAGTHRLLWGPNFADKAGTNWRSRRGIGLSWVLGEYRGHPVVSHPGGDTGFVSDFVMVPDKGVAVIWMMNADWPRRVTLTTTALDVALGPDGSR